MSREKERRLIYHKKSWIIRIDSIPDVLWQPDVLPHALVTFICDQVPKLRALFSATGPI